MPGRVFTEPERTRMGAFPSEIAEPDMIRPCSAIDSKKFIYLRHDPDRALIFGIDLTATKNFRLACAQHAAWTIPAPPTLS